MASSETQYALNRAQRLYDRTEHAWWHTRGPEVTRDLTTREKLDRPTIKIMQRHPGTNMPEAQELVRVGITILTRSAVVLTPSGFSFKVVLGTLPDVWQPGMVCTVNPGM